MSIGVGQRDQRTQSRSTEVIVDLRALRRRFGRRAALRGVDLRIGRGEVHGLVGANGAGKTTLIRHVLGLLRAQEGSVRVFGLDPTEEPVRVLSRIGYLSEENDLPGWLRTEELLRYTRAFRPDWDDDYAEELQAAFDLDPETKIRGLSKGQKARVGLVAALAYRPELLVLDEPSSGLDPLVRRDILGALVRDVANDGRSVLFSSHLLDEVEQVADRVTMIDRGRVLLSGSLSEIRESYRTTRVRFDEPRRQPVELAEVALWTHEPSADDTWTALTLDGVEPFARALSTHSARVVDERPASLDEVFVALAATPSSNREGD